MDNLKSSLSQSRGYAVIILACLVLAILSGRPDIHPKRPTPHQSAPRQIQETTP